MTIVHCVTVRMSTMTATLKTVKLLRNIHLWPNFTQLHSADSSALHHLTLQVLQLHGLQAGGPGPSGPPGPWLRVQWNVRVVEGVLGLLRAAGGGTVCCSV